MITIDCPWCDERLELAPSATDVACDTCRVVVELAPDPQPVVAAAA